MDESYIRLHYSKHEYMVPMRDGVKLMTSVFVPKDTTKTYPILMKRTPYNVSPYGADKYSARLGPSEHFVKAGYIFVNQDVRGRFASEGEFIQVTPHNPNKTKPTDVDESSDTYDTIEWLLKNVSQHNGRVGMYGISYPGFYAAAGMIDAHPALKAVSPQAPVGDWYFDDFLHHGSFFLAHAFKWLSGNATERQTPTTEPAIPYVYPMSDGYKMFLEAGSVENIDKLYLKGNIPFWTDMMQHPNRDEFWQKRALMPHLKNVAPAVMTVTGWYDGCRGSGTGSGFDEFVSDPAKPVPCSETITPRMTIEYMVDDQRFASRRPDVLTWQTDVFTEDTVIAGPLMANLWVSTTGTDADWIVKLIDVRPDGPETAPLAGYQMLLRSEVIRGRYRNDYAKHEPFVPNQPTLVKLELLDVLHRFQKGHRLMVQIQSTWFPLVDRNPQTFVPNIYFAKPDDFQKATHRVFRSADHPTHFSIGVLPATSTLAP